MNTDRENGGRYGTDVRDLSFGSVFDLPFSTIIWSGFSTNGVYGKTYGEVLLGSG